MNEFLMPLIGGAIIGIAISIMLLFNGRVTGVSGIVSGALRKGSGDFSWRIAFVLGLICGGFILHALHPEMFRDDLNRSLPVIIIAGLLVGFGTVMGSGCTSGHGICGISRLSPRSLVSTVLFILFGVISATLFRVMTGAS